MPVLDPVNALLSDSTRNDQQDACMESFGGHVGRVRSASSSLLAPRREGNESQYHWFDSRHNHMDCPSMYVADNPLTRIDGEWQEGETMLNLLQRDSNEADRDCGFTL